tara:strand:- start:305 stop:709 length:405 start_codon:yes stop_codon:yes gene_type:complete
MSSKLSKSDLKEIVRECLLEILTEGAGSRSSQRPSPPASSRRAAFDHVTWASEKAAEREPVDYAQTARSLTDNNILAEVLADSQKTMIDQMQAEKMGKSALAGDFAERKVATSDPTDLFSEASQNWEALAFGIE